MLSYSKEVGNYESREFGSSRANSVCGSPTAVSGIPHAPWKRSLSNQQAPEGIVERSAAGLQDGSGLCQRSGSQRQKAHQGDRRNSSLDLSSEFMFMGREASFMASKNLSRSLSFNQRRYDQLRISTRPAITRRKEVTILIWAVPIELRPHFGARFTACGKAPSLLESGFLPKAVLARILSSQAGSHEPLA